MHNNLANYEDIFKNSLPVVASSTIARNKKELKQE